MRYLIALFIMVSASIALNCYMVGKLTKQADVEWLLSQSDYVTQLQFAQYKGEVK